MENKEHTIIVADFYAFSMKQQRAFVDMTEEQVLEELSEICKTLALEKLTTYRGFFVNDKLFNLSDVLKK
jgi:hypothetical protein